MSRLVFSPLSIWFLLGLILLVVVGLPLLFLGVIGAALARLGFSFWVVVLLLVVIVAGSFVNVPLCTMRRWEGRGRKPRGQYAPSMYDRMYRTDRWESEEEGGMAVSMNVGGAVVPVLISVYLVGLVVLGEVAGGEWFLVRMGAAVMGCVAGTLGTLIGADLLHLREVYAEGCGMLSIGGAGTFDGIFLTAIGAALLASF
jgi:uncharacterized membrane protein